MSNRTLSECPVFITNMEALIGTISDILHEIDAGPLSEADRDELNRTSSLLSIAHQACGMFVDEVERGSDYRLSDSPVRTMFDLWLELRDEANKAAENHVPPDVLDGIFAKANAAAKRMIAEPATDREDLAAKLVTITDHGSYMDLSAFPGGKELVMEAVSLVGRAGYLDVGDAS